MTYIIRFSHSAKKDIRRIPSAILQRIQDAMDALRKDPLPDGCEPIRGYKHCYRIRIGNYRVVYEVATQIRIITIIRIGHRQNVYQEL